MPTLPVRGSRARSRNSGERSRQHTPEGGRNERGSSSLSSPNPNAKTPESKRRSEGRYIDSMSQSSPAANRAARDDRHTSSNHGSENLSSPASRSSKEVRSPLASRSTTERFSPPTSKSSKERHGSPRPTELNKEARALTTPINKGEVRMSNSNVSMTENPSEVETQSQAQMLRRPRHGTKGYEINLKTNCFEIKPDASVQLYQYHVNVLPEPNTARQRKQAFDLFLKNAGFLNRLRRGGSPPVVATDHRSTLITRDKIDPQDKEHDRYQCVIVYYEAEEGEPKKTPSINSHIFTVSFCQPLPLQSLMTYLDSTSTMTCSKINGSILQALSLVVARKPIKTTGVTATKNENRFFPKVEPLVVLEGGLVVLQGFQATVKMMGSRLFVNVNPKTGIFYREEKEGSLLDLMDDFRKTSLKMEQLQTFVQGIRISLPHLSSGGGEIRIKTVSGLASLPKLGANANQVSFNWNEKEVTVADYYAKRYDVTLRAPTMSVVNIGTTKRPTYVPPELCKVLPRQMSNKPLTPVQHQQVATALKNREEDAISIVGGAAKALAIGTKDSQGPKLFGLEIEPSVLSLTGRVLPAPPLQYKGATFKPDFGSWNLKDQRKFNTGAGINQWTYLQIQNTGKDTLGHWLEDFITDLQKSYASTIGKPARCPQPLTLNGISPGDMFAALNKTIGTLAGKGIRMLLIILPDKRQTLFTCVKYLADVNYGIQTTCIAASEMRKRINKSWYAATIAQKLNTKGGGVNQSLPKDELETLLPKTTMIVGIDVTNPFPKGQANAATSIIGVVASKTLDFTQWPASARRQDSPDKVSLDLKEMIAERLHCWKTANEALPASILVYRAGATNSHTTVIAQETKSIEDALKGFYAESHFPDLTIMTVSKIHSTRFYPADAKAGDGQSGNPKAGTVVDRVLTSQAPWDFYLQSHPGTSNSGTVCPAHYVVVRDDMGLGADGVQQLTNKLCYISGRGTRALSVVPPAHYANLVCERARCYVQASLIPSDEGGSVSGTTGSGERPSQWKGGVHRDLQDSMWYI